ncbi:MAG TPA: cyclic nucleotide-binding domain-containing protein, partial [Candidatus Angelobacter sp.]|nr:cyclic nucleotide-binding domain-containing protein [Candidatus Angelobacter sp.]
MVETSELRHLPIFAGLPDDQIAWFISQTQEVTLQPDEIYVHQGDPAEAMFVLLEGQLEARGEIAGENIVVSSKAGDVT